ncbi:hypothetical protein [Propionibacterium sp.]|uniref:hypothetical protein n=1 Tax=Propionibacterium sp. TaxID=1977903 RepID=UPI0039E89FAC
MSQLVYGIHGQVRFRNEQEKQEAMDYLTHSPDVDLRLEHNEEQGAWAEEKRIYFHSTDGVPECLRRNWNAGIGLVVGRINAADLYDEVKAVRDRG